MFWGTLALIAIEYPSCLPRLGCLMFAIPVVFGAAISGNHVIALLVISMVLVGVIGFFNIDSLDAAAAKRAKAAVKTPDRIPDPNWGGSEGLSFIEACNEAGLNPCEREMFYSVAHSDRCWGRYGETVSYAKEWKEGYGPMLKQHCPDDPAGKSFN
jgi:hypothetical protein